MRKLILLSGLLIFASATAQTATPQTATAPQTAIAAALSQTGTLTVRQTLGEADIKTNGGILSIEAVTVFTPERENAALRGIAFSVTGIDRYASARTEFVEPSEIDGLIKAIEYIQSQAAAITASSGKQITFKSKSGVKIGIFYSSYDKAPIGYVTVSSETAYLTAAGFEPFRQSLIDLASKLK